MNSKIKHSGIVEDITGEHVKVRILQTSACAQCKIAGHCNSSESKEKIVDVYNVADVSRLCVGDNIVVTASRHMAVMALFVGFGLPFIVLVAIIFIIYGATGNEPLAALCGLGGLVPYYIGVWLFRGKLKTSIAFEIE